MSTGRRRPERRRGRAAAGVAGPCCAAPARSGIACAGGHRRSRSLDRDRSDRCIAPVRPEPAATSRYAYVGPVGGHLLGFDCQGRDLLSRLLAGARNVAARAAGGRR